MALRETASRMPSPRAATQASTEATVGGRLPEEADLTDRQRLAAVLQGVAWLAHRTRAGHPLPQDWDRLEVDPQGVLVEASLPESDPATAPLPQTLAAALLRRLFRIPAGDPAHETGGPARRIAGRGEGRRAGRVLLEEWSQELVPIPPDRLVEQVLDAAPFLWDPAFADSRRRLVDEVLGESPEGGSAGEAGKTGKQVHVAGPRRWRERLLALAADRDELEELVTGELGRELWQTLRRTESDEGRTSGADKEPGGSPVESARRLYRQGRFEAALDRLAEAPFEAGAVLRAACHGHLGQYEAARRILGRLERLDLAPLDQVCAGEVAVRVLHALERADAATAWVARSLEAAAEGDDPVRWRAELLAALDAWDRGDADGMEARLQASRAAQEIPDLGWRWHHGTGLLALARGEGSDAREPLRQALGLHRRHLARFEAGAVWNDLGIARAQTGDLAGAERAFLHSLRLYERCDGPSRVTLALQNLAEIRLRRGRSAGTRGILERASSVTRRSGNRRAQIYDTSLWARYELTQGRPEAALTLCREALEDLEPRWDKSPDPPPDRGDTAGLDVLAVRILGWLGRSPEAAEAAEALATLETRGGDPRSVLEAEEIAPLWALAGDRERALREIAEPPGSGPGPGPGAPSSDSDPSRRLWRGLLTGRPVPAEAWQGIAALEPFRFARCVFDAELLFPGQVPVGLRRRAVVVFRRLGAGWFAERLEARDTGPWGALAGYLKGSTEDIEELFLHAGHPGVRLWWETSERVQILIEGPGGELRVTAPCADGRLVLTAPTEGSTWSSGPPDKVAEGESAAGEDAAGEVVLEALLRLVARDFVPRAPDDRGSGEGRNPGDGRAARSGMVGSSPVFVEALERIERFAASELPVVLLGESGTGKELAARYLHRSSRRAEAPFVAINCAALSESLQLSDLFGHVRGAFTGAERDRAGVFETAQGGTVFLDEIGDLAASGQGMLLRVLQEGEVRRVGETLPRKVDVRVVAATHRDLAERVREGAFREDLYYRLRGARVELPPLRDRGDDLDLLSEHLLQRWARPAQDSSRAGSDSASRSPRLSSAARRALRAHSWPGNIRELENVLGTAVALAGDGPIEAEHLDLPTPSAVDRKDRPGAYHQQVEGFRRRLVQEALAAADGNQSEAARRLGLTRQALSYLVRQFEL